MLFHHHWSIAVGYAGSSQHIERGRRQRRCYRSATYRSQTPLAPFQRLSYGLWQPDQRLSRFVRQAWRQKIYVAILLLANAAGPAFILQRVPSILAHNHFRRL